MTRISCLSGTFIALALALHPLAPAKAHQANMSDMIAGMSIASTFNPIGFEKWLEGTRATLTPAYTIALKDCLATIYRIGESALYQPPPEICLPNGDCRSNQNPLGELALWASSMTAAVDGTPWTRTTSGSLAVMKAQALQLACPAFPGFCDEMKTVSFNYMKEMAQVCD